MLRFIQTEIAGLRSRWLRILALLTCLVMAVVVAEQQRAIETQRSLIASLTADSNHSRLELKQPRISIYITDSHIIEPASDPPQKPAVRADKSAADPARFNNLL